jgi:antitoxin (DNA-binding transcriptional repressor) of toxin-antitoxin stability system
MLTKTVDVNEAQTQWAKLLSLVKTGIEIIFMEGSTFIVRLVPIASSSLPRLPGLHAGAIRREHHANDSTPKRDRG